LTGEGCQAREGQSKNPNRDHWGLGSVARHCVRVGDYALGSTESRAPNCHPLKEERTGDQEVRGTVVRT